MATQCVVLLGIPFGVLLWRTGKADFWIKLLTSYLICCFAAFWASHFAPYLGTTNNEVHAVYGMVEMVFIFFIYRHLFGGRPSIGVVVLVLVVLLGATLLNLLFVQGKNINSYAFTGQAFIYSVLAIAYFFHLLQRLPTLMIQRFAPFWFNAGVLVYFTGNLLLFAITHYLVHHLKNDLRAYWTFHNVLFLFGTGFMCLSLWMEYRLQKSR